MIDPGQDGRFRLAGRVGVEGAFTRWVCYNLRCEADIESVCVLQDRWRKLRCVVDADAYRVWTLEGTQTKLM